MTLQITAPSRLITGIGNPDADIMIVGDVLDTASWKAGRPFAGPAETVLETCLHQAGLTKVEVYQTVLIKDDTKIEKYWKGQSGKEKIQCDISKYEFLLGEEVDKVEPKIIVTLDGLPSYLFTHKRAITKIRGYPFKTNYGIIIPSLHPSKMIWSNYIWRHYLSHDLKKAAELAQNPEKLYQPEIEYRKCETFAEAREQLDYCATFKKLSVDIEVTNYEVSCVGFAISPTLAYSIPFDMRWSVEEEVQLWRQVAIILGSESITKIGQNFIFDIYFLAYRMGIFTKGPIIDTMMSHSILYPDFLKALNFLGSVYTNQPYWKDMVSFKDIKQES